MTSAPNDIVVRTPKRSSATPAGRAQPTYASCHDPSTAPSSAEVSRRSCAISTEKDAIDVDATPNEKYSSASSASITHRYGCDVNRR
jgi:hypothetical protein